MLEDLKIKFGLNDALWATFKAVVTQLEVPAKTVLLQEGDIANRIYLIEKGCIRGWFNKDGVDVTIQFFAESETVASMESFKKRVPSLITLESIEPCNLWAIDRAGLERLLPELDKIPELRQLFMDKLFDRLFDYMQHFFSFIKDTPAQRYEALLRERPQLVNRVAQHYIASYRVMPWLSSTSI